VDETPKPPRRKRYPGKNPRTFSEKYKELSGQAFASDVEKVIARGQTPAGTHRAVMVSEVLEALALRPGDVVLDCTLGYGGHAQAILQAIQPTGRLLAMDRDSTEIAKTESRLGELGYSQESMVMRPMNFAGAAQFLAELSPEGVDAMMVDLGVSSMQIDDPSRGFGYKEDGPLDMRMNPTQAITARSLLSQISQIQLTNLLTDNADEPNAQNIARAILKIHAKQPIATTFALAEAIRTIPHSALTGGVDGAIRRVFQAIRMSVNDEMGALESFLHRLPTCLKPGGRVAILSFHSGEDRRVKTCFKDGFRQGVFQSIARDLVSPSAEEIRSNPRCRSAKLRYATKSRSS
jgi:16S rRNA (cytosine1402-N4)-methyltransferase